MSRRANELIDRLGLEVHPEGGHYREIFRSGLALETQEEVQRTRCGLTSIYFLLRAGQISRWHVVSSDEAWHFYEGEPLELFVFDPRTNSLIHHLLGPRVTGEQIPVAVVPAGCWQAARPLGEYSLVGCSVGPGFEFDDFRFVSELEGGAARIERTEHLRPLRELL